MSPASNVLPPEPAVEHNTFRTKSVVGLSITPLSEARQRLPEPVLPNRPEWVEMYWRAWEATWSQLRRARPSAGLVANHVGPDRAGLTTLWDSAFVSQFGLYGRRAFNFLGGLDNFYARQDEDGFLTAAFNTETGEGHFPPYSAVAAAPNVLGYAEWRYYRLTGDSERINDAFWPLVGYHRWLRKHRTWRNGLYWSTGISSQLPNQARVPDGATHHQHWIWVDASIQAAINCLHLNQMALMLDEQTVAEEMAQERQRLVRAIHEQLWNGEAAFYQDLGPAGNFSTIKSIAAYWALFDKGLLEPKRLDQFIAHLRKDAAFKTPHRLPSMSLDSPGFEPDENGCCRGAVVPAFTYTVVKGLRHVGRHKLAFKIARNHLRHVCDIFSRTDTFWATYPPNHVEQLDRASSDFVGLTALTPIALLLEDVIGLDVDWPLKRVIWDRRLDDEKIGVRNFPLGSSQFMDLIMDGQKLHVTTDASFTLTIQDANGTIQIPVSSGTMEVDLA